MGLQTGANFKINVALEGIDDVGTRQLKKGWTVPGMANHTVIKISKHRRWMWLARTESGKVPSSFAEDAASFQ